MNFHGIEWGNETGERCIVVKQEHCKGDQGGRPEFAPTCGLPEVSVLSDFFIQFSSCVRGVTLGIMPLVLYTQNATTHTHALIQVLYSLFQKRTSVSLSRRACTCPQVSKRFLLIPEKHPFCCIKNATIAEMLPN